VNVGFAVNRLSGYAIQLAPGLPHGQVHLALFFLGKLLVGNEFFHNVIRLMVSADIMLCFQVES